MIANSVLKRGMSPKAIERPSDDPAPARGIFITALVGALSLMLPGCEGVPTEGERRAQQDLQTVAAAYRPQHQRPPLPQLRSNESLSTFLQFAILNQPRVEAAYYDWAATVRRITVARSLPDPQFRFEMDVADIVSSVLPGLMMDFPGFGKLEAAANVATAESQAKYFAFESSVLQTAFGVKKAYYQHHFVDAKIGVNQETLRLLANLEKVARAQHEAGKATLQDVLRVQIEHDRVVTAISNLKDSRNVLLAQFKAALGLKEPDPTPPVPVKFESTALDLTSDRLLAFALARNPRLKAMEAEVHRADAEIRVAEKAQVPDFTAGMKANTIMWPFILTPEFRVTLPVWRDKIRAQIEGAEAGRRAAAARLSAEQIALVVEFVEKLFLFREASRNLELFSERLLPKSRQSLEVAQSAYIGGQLEFLNVIDAQRSLLDFSLSAVEARVQRELALAELSLIILGTPPAGAPVLPPDAADRRPERP
jgi:outer membrane protein TolC